MNLLEQTAALTKPTRNITQNILNVLDTNGRKTNQYDIDVIHGEYTICVTIFVITDTIKVFDGENEYPDDYESKTDISLVIECVNASGETVENISYVDYEAIDNYLL